MHKLTNSIKGNVPDQITIPNGGMRVGEIIGYRIWKASWFNLAGERKPILRSYVINACMWHPGKIMDSHDLGWFEPAHGFYAWKRKQDALKYVKNRHEAEFEINCRDLKTKTVVGTIQMWGEVIEHATGYRSEFAYIKSIDQIINGTVSELIKLRERYGVGV